MYQCDADEYLLSVIVDNPASAPINKDPSGYSLFYVLSLFIQY
jgi:hypothetical protein